MHELKSPILAQIDALKNLEEMCHDKLNDEERDMLQLTYSSCNHVWRIIDTFNTARKLEQNRIYITSTKFDIIQMFQDILQEFKIILKYSRLKFELSKDESIIVNADKFYMKRAMEYLLDLCINHAYSGSVLKIKLQKQKRNFDFEIKAKGTFIDAEALDEIYNQQKICFKKYNRPSINMGLYLAKRIITAHFGTTFAKNLSDDMYSLGFSIPVD